MSKDVENLPSIGKSFFGYAFFRYQIERKLVEKFTISYNILLYTSINLSNS